jgi:hypothetical protein
VKPLAKFPDPPYYLFHTLNEGTYFIMIQEVDHPDLVFYGKFQDLSLARLLVPKSYSRIYRDDPDPFVFEEWVSLSPDELG